jgi:hypothetical protein
VVSDHVRAARAVWDAFRAPDPRGLARAVASPDARLPFMAPALQRLLEELPGARDGLSRTERQLLAAVAAGAGTSEEAFLAAADNEEARFLGDDTAFERLNELASGPHPLLTSELTLTDAGADVLAARADRVALNGFDRWLGGVHLRAANGLWRWDAERGMLVEP